MDESGAEIQKEKIETPEKERWMSYEKIAVLFHVSRDRVRRLLNTNVVEGEKRWVQTKKGMREKWFSTVEKVAVYFRQLKPTPSEAGKRPPKKGMMERGRPRERLPQSGVVFQAS